MINKLLTQRNLFLSALFVFATMFGFNAQAQDKSSYETLKKVQQPETVGKTEVLEFFAYTCPHCKTLEPLASKWAENLPADSVLVRIPVDFRSQTPTNLQKLYYTLESLDRLDLHPAVFNRIHTENKSIYEVKDIIEWAVSNGIDEQTFTDVFNSFGINTRVVRANELVKNYDIQATPTLVIGGKYVTSPSHAKGYEQSIKVAEQLLDKVRNE